MANKFDLTKLEGLSAGLSAELVRLSPETVNLCLMALSDRAVYRGAWVDDDAEISDARWDDADGFVQRAKAELMTTGVAVDGGTA